MTDDNERYDVSIDGRTIPMELVHQTNEAALVTCRCCEAGTAAILRDGVARASNDEHGVHVEAPYEIERHAQVSLSEVMG
jgi:hypothetical protein